VIAVPKERRRPAKIAASNDRKESKDAKETGLASVPVVRKPGKAWSAPSPVAALKVPVPVRVPVVNSRVLPDKVCAPSPVAALKAPVLAKVLVANFRERPDNAHAPCMVAAQKAPVPAGDLVLISEDLPLRAVDTARCPAVVPAGGQAFKVPA
jgi:hypothetical protein